MNLFFPKLCLVCQSVLSDHEIHFCSYCRHDFPVMDLEKEGRTLVEKIFYGRADITSAIALLRFEKKGIVQKLLHNLKYRGREEIGFAMGQWFGSELRHLKGFEEVEIVLPVPVHKSKLKKRGYNQVDEFARQIAEKLNAEFMDDVLLKTRSTPTKVFQKRIKRWQSDNDIFILKNQENISNKNVLLIDDIITTGATIEACSQVLHTASNIKLSVAAMAIAS